MGLSAPTKKQLGERSQAYIIARLLEVGYIVLTPYGDSSRYDPVIEDAENRFWRVQCKTAWVEGEDNGYIKFATTSLRSHSMNGKVQYSRAKYTGQIDFFAVYSHEQHKTCLIPANQATGNTMRLRLTYRRTTRRKV
jgi:PD-(D/E)XK endonuclease